MKIYQNIERFFKNVASGANKKDSPNDTLTLIPKTGTDEEPKNETDTPEKSENPSLTTFPSEILSQILQYLPPRR